MNHPNDRTGTVAASQRSLHYYPFQKYFCRFSGKLRGIRAGSVGAVRRPHPGHPRQEGPAAGVHPTGQGDARQGVEGTGRYLHPETATDHRSAAVLHRGSEGNGQLRIPAGESPIHSAVPKMLCKIVYVWRDKDYYHVILFPFEFFVWLHLLWYPGNFP